MTAPMGERHAPVDRDASCTYLVKMLVRCCRGRSLPADPEFAELTFLPAPARTLCYKQLVGDPAERRRLLALSSVLLPDAAVLPFCGLCSGRG